MKTLLIALLCFSALSQDVDLANALAGAGAALAGKSRPDQAEDVLLRALVYDEHCGRALFELAKLYDKRGATHDAEPLYRSAARVLGDGKDRAEAVRRADMINPAAARLACAVDQYAEDVGAAVRANPLLTEEAARRLARFSRAIPREKKFFRGERLAEVVFSETMGYGVGELKSGAPSHLGHTLKYASIPEEMSGLKYTLIVPGTTSPLSVRFKTDGVLLILLNKSFSGEARQRLEKVAAAKIKIADVSNVDERYEVFALKRKAGETVELMFYVLVAADLSKGVVK